jgi:hypothetical protein
MTIGSGVFEEELSVLLQRTAAVIEVVDLDIDMLGIAKRHQFLLYGIPRERVSDAENTDEK